MAPPRPPLGVPCYRRCNARNHTPDTTVYPRSKGMSTLISWAGIQGEKAGTAQGRLEVRSTWRTLWAQRRIRNCECCRKPQLRLWVGWGQGGGAIWGTVEVGHLFWRPSLADEDQCRTVEQETWTASAAPPPSAATAASPTADAGDSSVEVVIVRPVGIHCLWAGGSHWTLPPERRRGLFIAKRLRMGEVVRLQR